MPEEAQEAVTETQDEPAEESSQETVEESQDEAQDQASEETNDGSQDAEKTEEETPQKYKIKIDGVEEEVTFDELQSLAQKAEGADRRFSEAAKERKRIEGVLEQLKADPLSVLTKLGVNTQEMAEKYLTDIYAKESMPEEQKKLLDAQEQIKKLQGEKQTIEKEKQERVLAVEAEKAKEEYDMQITAALEKTDLPRSPNTIGRVANYLLQGLQEGVNIPVDKAVALVVEDIQNEGKSVYEKMEADKIIKMLGPDVVKKLKGYDLSKIKTPEDMNKVKEAVAPKSKGGRRKKRTWDEIKEELDNLTGSV